VGSTPTQSIILNLVEYGIVLSSILTIVGQKISNANRAFFTLQGDLCISQTLQGALREISIVALIHLFL